MLLADIGSTQAILLTAIFSLSFILLGLVVLSKILHNHKLEELFVDSTTGKLSTTAVWSNIANATATVVFTSLALNTKDVTQLDFMWFTYMGMVGFNSVAMKFLNIRYANTDEKGQKIDSPAASVVQETVTASKTTISE